LLYFGLIAAYLLFAIAIGKLLSYSARQDEVWSGLREHVIRPPDNLRASHKPTRSETKTPALSEAAHPAEKISL